MIYYEKVKSLHPIFRERYEKWTNNDKNKLQFVPEHFNQQYNDFRVVGWLVRSRLVGCREKKRLRVTLITTRL